VVDLNQEICNVSGLYSVVACFKYQLEHCINYMKAMLVVLNLTRRISGYYFTYTRAVYLHIHFPVFRSLIFIPYCTMLSDSAS
jgi:hypothetical protein